MTGVPRDAPVERHPAPPKVPFLSLDLKLRALILASGVLALAAVPEVFVVLWARQSGLPVAWVPLVWAAASFGKMLVSYPAGKLSDRLGRLPLLIGGWALRVVALVALATVHASGVLVWALFVSYSATLALTEPVERSLVGDVAPPAQRGTAYGLYHLASGALVLPGAVLFGLLWEHLGSTTAFSAAALVTAIAALGMAAVARGAGSPAR